MKEVCEFRIYERFTSLLSKPTIGQRVGGSVRKVIVPVPDPVFTEIGALHTRLRKTQGTGLFSYWNIQRSYSEAELASAELFRLIVTTAFEPAGEECGTTYDEGTACEICKANANQTSELFLDFRKIPPRSALARTIANELVVSDNLASILREAEVNGIEFKATHHRPRFEDDLVDLSKLSSGKLLLERASAEGISAKSARYYLWLNQPEQRELLDAARRENFARKQTRARGSHKKWPIWYQLWIASNRLSVTDPTRTGIDPFNLDCEGEYRCPRGDKIGLRFLSEIYVQRASWDGADMMLTRQVTGVRRGLLRPTPTILVSPRLRGILIGEKVRGVRFEIAHFV